MAAQDQPTQQHGATEDLPQALLACILGMAGLWGSSTAGWSVCRAWKDAMMQNLGAVAEALALKRGGVSTALFSATRHGHAGVVAALLSAGAEVDGVWNFLGFKQEWDDTWPLWVASRNGHVEVVRTLLAAGAAVDLLRPCVTPLLWRHMNRPGTDGGTSPLWVASRFCHVEVVRALLLAGAQVDLARTADNTSPLWVASQYGHVEVVHDLPAAGAAVHLLRSHFNTPPLWVASQNGHAEVVRALLAAGAQVDLVRNDAGNSPL